MTEADGLKLRFGTAELSEETLLNLKPRTFGMHDFQSGIEAGDSDLCSMIRAVWLTTAVGQRRNDSKYETCFPSVGKMLLSCTTQWTGQTYGLSLL
jgi:hypothetical protein